MPYTRHMLPLLPSEGAERNKHAFLLTLTLLQYFIVFRPT